MKKHFISFSLFGVIALGAAQFSAIAQSRENTTTSPQPNVGTTQPNVPANPANVPAPTSGGQSIESVTSLSVTKGVAGEFIVDSKGKSLYVLEEDLPKQSKCTEQCAKIWIPARVASGQTPVAGEKVNSTMLGSFQRPDGITQLTYNDMPLYYYVQDQGAGETRGQGVRDDFGTWFLVKPDGTKLVPPINPSTVPSGGSSTSPSTSSNPTSALELNLLVPELTDSTAAPQSRDSDRNESSYSSNYGYGHGHGHGHNYNNCYYWGNCYGSGYGGGYGCGYYTCYYNGYCCNSCGSCYYRGSYY